MTSAPRRLINRKRTRCILQLVRIVCIIAIESLTQDHTSMTQFSFQFFNSFLKELVPDEKRSATLSGVLFEYRQVAMHLLTLQRFDFVITISRHWKHYSDMAHRHENIKASELIAYDMACLLQLAAQPERDKRTSDDALMPLKQQEELLSIFLQLDKDEKNKTRDEKSILNGVRKAQMKLAAYYMYSADVMLSKGLAVSSRSLWLKKDSKMRLAMKIRLDMFVQSPELDLTLLCDEMKEVKATSCELQERGFNVEYVPERLHEYLERFVALDELKCEEAIKEVLPVELSDPSDSEQSDPSDSEWMADYDDDDE